MGLTTWHQKPRRVRLEFRSFHADQIGQRPARRLCVIAQRLRRAGAVSPPNPRGDDFSTGRCPGRGSAWEDWCGPGRSAMLGTLCCRAHRGAARSPLPSDIGGKIQEEAGKLVGSTEQQVKGLKHQAEGKMQNSAGDLKEAVGGLKEAVKQ